MSINLAKGSRINLSKESPSLTRLRVELGWEPNKFATGTDFDLDSSVFVCKYEADGSPKLLSDNHFVFYGNPQEPEGALKHHGDCRNGGASSGGADEKVTIDLTKLNAAVQEISFIVTIHEADVRKQNFGQVNKSFIALYDDVSGAEIAKYPLDDDFSSETAVQFGSLYKRDEGAWAFRAVGAGFNKGLGDFVMLYGGNLA